MENYIFSIRMAFLFFPFLAALFTLPFLLLQYHRYGAVPILRAAVVYSMVLYLLCTYFLVILPLPSVEEAAARTDAWYNLKPFVVQWRYLRAVRPDLTTLSAWKAMARSQVWQEPALNVLMLIPFGVYLRYYFGRSWWQTVLASLALSAFFELTQLSGLYGIYPRPYRLCDVTDLITNTTGGLVGLWLAPLFSFFLPSRERLREIAYQRGQKVSMLRRGLAFLLDWSLVGIPLVLFAAARAAVLLWLCGPVYFVLAPLVTGGYTVGSWLCSFRIVDSQGQPVARWRYLVRMAALYLPFCSLLALWVVTPPARLAKATELARLGLAGICCLLTLTLVVQTVRGLFREKIYYYERISGTRLASTIPVQTVQAAES